MNTYLTIMVTVLVMTQVIRIIQNGINLARQEDEINKQITWLKNNSITEQDIDVQREAYYMLHEKLQREGYMVLNEAGLKTVHYEGDK